VRQFGVLTNLVQLRQYAERNLLVVHPFRIEAEVLDVDTASGVVILRDESDVEVIRLDLRSGPIEPGETVSLEGSGCGVRTEGIGLEIIPQLVVDNDGTHGMTVQSGRTFLHVGANPIKVQWFNRAGSFGLAVEYEGGGLPRQPIPASVLSRAAMVSATGATHFMAGLDYKCYEGTWVRLPDFEKHQPVRSGVTTNFDLGVRTRDAAVGLEFTGFLTVTQAGVYTFYTASDDGSRLFAGESSLELRVLAKGAAPQAISGVPATVHERSSHPWVTLEGIVKFAGVRDTGEEMVLQVGNQDLRVDIMQGRGAIPALLPDSRIQVSGIYQDVVAEDGSPMPGMLKVCSWRAIRPMPAPTTVSADFGEQTPPGDGAKRGEPSVVAKPVIWQVADIKTMPLARAAEQVPVTIRGVITAILPSFIGAVVVQDSTKGISVSTANATISKPLERGDLCEVEGVTGPGLYAPVIAAHRITVLGAGQMPRPLYPRRHQLIDGSVDTQYVEVEGVVTAVNGQQIVLLTGGESITLELNDFQAEELAGYENALVRIRGCALAFFNVQTHELDARVLRLSGATVDVLEAAAADLFDTPEKSMGQLLLYDPNGASFRRLKVRGQVIYGGAGEYFLTDGTNGMRATTRNQHVFEAGDWVEAVGFLNPEGLAAEFKEAALRKIGQAPLPAPARLKPDELLMARYADRLVQVDGTLLEQWRDGPESMLRLQSGFITFRAQVDTDGKSLTLPPPGSRLELTGAYSPQGNRAPDGTVSGFELLLHSPAAIRVLATPPWWTLKRMFILAAILTALLAAVVIWNKELQRMVQERGRRLELEIRNRQRAEMQHAAEAERSRIARDLHDELGTGLTEVNLLANAGLSEAEAAARNTDRFRVIAEKARSLVSGLDVIVWAIDPKLDSLQSFADYLEIYAEELLSAANIACRLKIPIEFKAATLAGTARHSLLLAVMEALNNVIRHAAASRVELKMVQPDGGLEITITDDGRGFELAKVRSGHGLKNLRERMQSLQGSCQIESSPGKGTTIKLSIPLPGAAESGRQPITT